MIFYHVSTDLQHDGTFEPRIPDCRHQSQEDISTGRISVAPTIEDCLTAIPNGGLYLEELNMERRGYYLIYRIDTEKLGIGEEFIVSPQELYEKDLVRDAGFSNEHWVTKAFTVSDPEDKFLISLKWWEEESEDVLPFSIFAIAETRDDGCPFEAYREIYEEEIPCQVSIHNLQFTHEQVQKKERVTLYFDDKVEGVAIQSYIEEHLPAEIEEIQMDEITFIMTDVANLSELFMCHARIAMVQS